MKLQIDGEVFPDPYDIDEKAFIHISFIQRTLKAYKSLEASKYFFNGYVQTMFSYELNRYACLKAKGKSKSKGT